MKPVIEPTASLTVEDESNPLLQEASRRIVESELGACASHLIQRLFDIETDEDVTNDLCSIDDWEEPATDNGATYDEDEDVWTDEDGEIYDSAEEFCRQHGHDPYEVVIFEYWIVSDWLSNRLQERGEKVVEVYGLPIWCRTMTGQVVYIDICMMSIAKQHGSQF